MNVLGSPCGLPSIAEAYVLNATVVPDGPLSYLTLWPDGTQRPLASTLNAIDGAITSNMAIVGTDNGKIDAYADGSTQLVLDTTGSYLRRSLLTITTTTLPQGIAGVLSQTQLMASGGEPSYSWVITSGSLPTGLSLSDTGVISGTPTTAGVYAFTVKVTDALMNTASANLSITIAQGPLVVITTSLPDGTVGGANIFSTTAELANIATTWSILTGSLQPVSP